MKARKQIFFVVCLMGLMVWQGKGEVFEEMTPREREKVVPAPKLEAPNEIKGKGATYSGIVVQAVKTPSVWQLINPWASKDYGEGYQNQTLDPYSDEVVNGLKLFSIEF